MMRGGLRATLVLLFLLGGDAAAGSWRTHLKDYRVELASDPDPPVRGRETGYILRLQNASGQQVGGAKVTLVGTMPDGMTVLGPLRESPVAGMYSGRVLFTMEGEWRLTVRILQAGTPLELTFTEQVGR